MSLLKHSILQQVIAPSTLTANTVFISIRNTGSEVLAFTDIFGQALFTGLAGTSGSLFSFQRLTATPTGGSTVTPILVNPAQIASDVEIRVANGGLSSVTPSGGLAYQLGVASAVGSSVPPGCYFSDADPFMVAPGDCLIVFANNAIVSGAQVTIHFRWYQTP